MTTSSPGSLCQSLDARKEQPIVMQKELMPDFRISLRPVSLHADNDINVLHEWLHGCSRKAGLPVDQLRVFFILLAESTYAQAFMVLLNEEIPIGQLEVYQVIQDELNDCIDARDSDYRIYVPVLPVVEPWPAITIQILQACLHYFFSCAGVERIFWVVPVNDKERNKLALTTGFRHYQLAHPVTIGGDQPANVYCYTKQIGIGCLLPGSS